MDKSGAGEKKLAADIVAFRDSLATLVEHLSQIRRRKKRTLDDMLSEILQASAADHEQRSWSMNIADCMEKERMDRREAQKSEREMHQDMTGLLCQQTQML